MPAGRIIQQIESMQNMQPIRYSMLGMPMDRLDPSEFVRRFTEAAAACETGYVCVPNVHQCIEAYDDPAYAAITRSARFMVSDSVVLHKFLALKYRLPPVEVLRGDLLTLAICQRAAEMQIPVALIGGKNDAVLAQMVSELERKVPGINVCFSWSPPFGPASLDVEQAMLAAIGESGARIVFVGLGCPKQERWMAKYQGQVPAMMIGVGAAFDTISGQVKMSPDWMHAAGLEWLHRLLSEPRRLWKRYLGTSPRFVWLFATREWLRNTGP